MSLTRVECLQVVVIRQPETVSSYGNNAVSTLMVEQLRSMADSKAAAASIITHSCDFGYDSKMDPAQDVAVVQGLVGGNDCIIIIDETDP